MKSFEWMNYSHDARKLVRRMLMKDPENRINLQDICNSKWIKKHQKVKTELTLPGSTKTKLEEPQTDLNTLNNTNNGSYNNFSSFKNSVFRRSLNKSKTEILYIKKTNNSITNILDKDEETGVDCINPSKYDLDPKFLQNSGITFIKAGDQRNSAYLMPFFMENYSVHISLYFNFLIILSLF